MYFKPRLKRLSLWKRIGFISQFCARLVICLSKQYKKNTRIDILRKWSQRGVTLCVDWVHGLSQREVMKRTWMVIVSLFNTDRAIIHSGFSVFSSRLREEGHHPNVSWLNLKFFPFKYDIKCRLCSHRPTVVCGAGEPYQTFTGGLLPLKENTEPYGPNHPCKDSVKNHPPGWG